MEKFYHATPAENVDSILQDGLKPSSANECDCGEGVHVTEKISEADLWCARFDHEIVFSGSDTKAVFAIFEVAIDNNKYDVVGDVYLGESLQDLNNLVICTEKPIPPSKLTIVKDER